MIFLFRRRFIGVLIGSLIGPLAALTVLTGVGGCDDERGWKKAHLTSFDLSRAPSNAELPAALWKRIEGLLHESEQGPMQPSSEQDGTGPVNHSFWKMNTLPTEFAPLSVYLLEKNKGLLKHGSVKLKFAAGGGELNLDEYIEPLRGSFYFMVDFLPERTEVKKHVYFLSNSIRREMGTEALGSGCHTYYDISSAFRSAVENGGFLLNTTDSRHISALAGTYFFAAVHAKKLYLAQLTVKSSSRRDLQCRP